MNENTCVYVFIEGMTTWKLINNDCFCDKYAVYPLVQYIILQATYRFEYAHKSIHVYGGHTNIKRRATTFPTVIVL